MNNIMAIALQEMRVGIKGVGYWVLVVLVNCLSLYTLYEEQFFALRTIAVFYMFFVFWNIGMIARDWRSGTAEIVNTLPCKDWELLLGRAVSNFLLLGLLGMQMFLVMATMALFVFPTSTPFFDLLWNYWLNYFLISINSICVTLFIETICRSSIFLTTLITAFYLILISILDGDHNTLLPYWLPPINLAYNVAATEVPSQLTERFPKNGFIPMVLCQQLGLSAMLFLVSYYFYSKQRSLGKLALSTILLVTAALAVFLSGSIPLVLEYKAREQSYQESFSNAVADAGQVADQSNRLQPVSYVMDIKLKTVPNTADCDVKLVFKNTSDSQVQEIPLTLKHYYTVQHVTDGSGKELVWERKGDFIAVKLNAPLVAGASMEIALDYSGKVGEWFTDYDAQPRGLINFVTPVMTLLRSGHAWYPVLGKKPVYNIVEYQSRWSNEPTRILSARNVSHPPAAFSITVEIDRDMEVVTGLPLRESIYLAEGTGRKFAFFSSSAQDVFLLAAPYVKIADQSTDVTTYYAKLDEENANTIITLVQDRTTFYENLIPRANKQDLNVVEVPQFLLDSWLEETAERKKLGLKNAILVSEYFFKLLPNEDTSEKKLQMLYFEEAVLSLWWPAFNTSDPGNISAGMLSYMYTLYKENLLGKTYYEDVKQFWLQYKPVPNLVAGENGDRIQAGGDNLVVKEIFLILDDIRQSELGDEGVKSFIQKIHAESVSTYDREIDWLDMLHIMDHFGQELLQKGYSTQQVNRIMKGPRQKAETMNSLNLSSVEEARYFRLRVR
ncbi:ABC transporter permease [Pelosinus propionicus]|uniref:ABC-type transport system involved in multi-copper enzyme maturation, permease component n=1 Tax=Pelosinus propionicus DSM 13327 TaxID=1123291 RepID=A0A1I4IKH0_9FIRM|nr:ABC transporter permease [Pelosinus propionicus]SFL54794.1 ABC-type transport system involved in multi-copper enzyme maturation, permease component [Pelosinus propionicus DSM 13327]